MESLEFGGEFFGTKHSQGLSRTDKKRQILTNPKNAVFDRGGGAGTELQITNRPAPTPRDMMNAHSMQLHSTASTDSNEFVYVHGYRNSYCYHLPSSCSSQIYLCRSRLLDLTNVRFSESDMAELSFQRPLVSQRHRTPSVAASPCRSESSMYNNGMASPRQQKAAAMAALVNRALFVDFDSVRILTSRT